MRLGRLVLVEPAFAGNLGAALRLAANFGVPRVVLVSPLVDPGEPEVARWACGAARHVAVETVPGLEEAVAGIPTVVGTASGRGRENLPVITPAELAGFLARRRGEVALVFGNETRGLRREALDRCDAVLRIPTRPEFPVLNLAQAVAIAVAWTVHAVAPAPPDAPRPAPHEEVERLVEHLRRALAGIGFLDPQNPERIVRKLRRLLRRAGPTRNEVAILHGICQQMLWAARHAPLRQGWARFGPLRDPEEGG